MNYRFETTTDIGFVQLLACNYIPHGYWSYVTGVIPEGKDPVETDARLIRKYRIDVSRATRCRRKAAGRANVHYVRRGRFFVLLATFGKHRFYADEEGSIRDVREIPIQFAGYSIGCKQGEYLHARDGSGAPKNDGRYRSRVQVSRPVYLDWKAYFAELAKSVSERRLAFELFNFPYEPYAPVRKQLLEIVRIVNRVRKEGGRSMLDPKEVIRFRRKIVRPFEPLVVESSSSEMEQMSCHV
jgi:hypothetical protein